jgi:hypothetical protein
MLFLYTFPGKTACFDLREEYFHKNYRNLQYPDRRDSQSAMDMHVYMLRLKVINESPVCRSLITDTLNMLNPMNL